MKRKTSFSQPPIRLLAAVIALLTGLSMAYSQQAPRTVQVDFANQIAYRYGAEPATVRRFLNAAIAREQEIGIPAAVVVAIALRESSFTSELFRMAGNPFGIKGFAPWDGPVYFMHHDGESTPFRVYNTPEEAVSDFGRFIQARAWYSDALACPMDDYACVVHGLKKTETEPGYALDPFWAQGVLSVLYENNLDQLTPHLKAPGR